MVVILMGVSGAGKSAVGELLADRLGWEFYDGDDFHPVSNIRKMTAGEPLNDEDRGPWLESIRAQIRHLEVTGTDAVVTCSALKETYRQKLLDGSNQTRLLYLRGSRALIEQRLRQRKGHYFDVGLLSSQFETLEEPSNAVVVEIDGDLESVISAVARALAPEMTGTSEEEGE